MPLSLELFQQRLAASGVLPAEEIAALLAEANAALGSEANRPKDGEQFARLLVRLKKLTAYQAQQIYSGQGMSLVLGNYVVLEQLGQGGMGVVLKAAHRRMKRVVALKVLSPAVTKNPDSLRRFQREVEAAARLDHPNIVTAYDADEANGTHFLVMQYVEGTDLAGVIKRDGPLPVPRAVDCILQAARGLDYAHRHGVIHRDVKPSNLLLDRSGVVKILDMGLARLDASGDQDQLTSTGQVMGTVDYMAPEQAVETHAADARSDIYSLGATLWSLLTGRVMYEGDTVVKRLMAHQQRSLPSLRAACPQVSQELDSVFQRMVAKSPDARPQSMQDVIAELQRCQSTADIFTTPFPSANAHAVPSPSSSAAGTDDTLDPSLGDLLRTLTHPGSPSAAAFSAPTVTAPAIVPGGALRTPIVTTTNPLVAEAAVTALLPNWSSDTDPQSPSAAGNPSAGESQTEERPGRRAARRRPQNAVWMGTALALATALTFIAHHLNSDRKPVAEPSPKPVWHDPDPGESELARQRTVQSQVSWQGWPAGFPTPAIAPFSADQARRHQEAWAAALQVPVEFENSLGMKFVLIPPGEFPMGSSDREIAEVLQLHTDPDRAWHGGHVRSESPQHTAILTQPFYLGVHEVTQIDYARIIGSSPSHFGPTGSGKSRLENEDTRNHPVESVSWIEAVEFCRKLSRHEQLLPHWIPTTDSANPSLGGNGYRLPTEAEWEFSCRAGTTTRFWTGDPVSTVDDAAWHGLNSGGRTHPVGKLRMNPFGLFDIHGNVSEWVQDSWDAAYYERFSQAAALDPPGASTTGANRIIRGGQYGYTPLHSRSADRWANAPTIRRNHIGLRVALSVDGVRKNLAGRNALGPVPDVQPRPEVRSAPPRTGLTFAGDGHVDLPDLPALSGTKYTVEALVTPARVPGQGERASVFQCLSRCDLLLSPLRQWFFLVEFKAANATPLGLPIELGRTVHLAAVRDGDQMRMYVDGRSSGPYKLPIDLEEQDAPAKKPQLGVGFHGTIHALRVSDVARYAGDFRPPAVLAPDSATHADYTFDEGEGDTLRDVTYHQRHGRIVRADWTHPLKPGEELADVARKKSIPPGPANAWPVDEPAPALAPYTAAQARAYQHAWAKHLEVDREFTNSLGMKFVLIPPGEFAMGSEQSEIDAILARHDKLDPLYQGLIRSEAPRRRVIHTHAFYLGVHEVTQGQYRRVIGGQPSHFSAEGTGNKEIEGLPVDDLPVESVTWFDAAQFCRKLSERDLLSPAYKGMDLAVEPAYGTGYRLPTEAEWEFACRAGTETPYSFGTIDTQHRAGGEMLGNDRRSTHPVEQFAANPFGLFGMHGNVREWCNECYQADIYGLAEGWPVYNPMAAFTPEGERVVRGGAWLSLAVQCRSSMRTAVTPASRDVQTGFRVLLPVEAVRELRRRH